ncbi:glycosyltransferase [Lacinutrix sp. WUR7]|uniref:glycosyltransferase n=1 Tax=Lacinutrix sp. WUR7 TaxID=2653681 RepID=UPI00193CB5A4|nr:glycosyltransferase [Lacinutrix sp. WUR7]QRM88719.1 glycosyltransferase [Lacinutrix sp. WUR7]
MKISIIIPCYNEEQRLNQDAFKAYSNDNQFIDFLFVNDGSSDNTANILKELSATNNNFSFLDLNQNQGKAGAIREGVLSLQENNTYDFIGYFDADLATPLFEINNFLEQIEKRKDMLFIMGTRFARMGAQINRKASRHYIGRIFATLVSWILKIPVYDTQCGAKLIHKNIVFSLFKDPLITKWLFDVELLARLEKLIGYKQAKQVILEVPLQQWDEIAGSKLKPTDFLQAPIELLKIWKKY